MKVLKLMIIKSNEAMRLIARLPSNQIAKYPVIIRNKTKYK